MKSNLRIMSIIFLLFTLIITACQSSWEIEFSTGDQARGEINQADVTFYIEKSLEESETLPLGQLLYHNGYSLIDQIDLISVSGESQNFIWDEIAEKTTISQAGAIAIGDQQYNVDSIAIYPSPQLNEISHSIMDIAPTVANALGLPAIPNAHGNMSWKPQGSIDHAIMILLDGLQLQKLQSLIEQGDLPFFDNLETVLKGLTIYPPITTSSTAALLTSTPPLENGVFGYGYRTTALTTLFDLALESDKTVTAVEGSSLPFNLRNIETILSGDRDGNGFSDDNVFSNSMDIIQSNLPDILYIHFHEIDDMGHEYGPNSDEYKSAIIRVDQYLYEIYKALPENTFVVIFADHGMHETTDGGNHGTLTAADLIIPIIFLEK